MAIRSALSSYIINEEQDGFVAVDFDFINGLDEEDRHDLTAWEFVDQVDTDVDDCSSIGEKSDDVSDSDEFAGSDVSSEYCAETIVGEDLESLPELSLSPEYFVCEDDDADDCSSIGGKSDDVSENVDFAGSLVSDMLEECLSERIAGEDAKSVPETIFLPVDEDAKSVKLEYSDANSSMCMTERTGGYIDSVTAYRSRGGEYCYEGEEELEEDDYDLDDELVPYCVNGKLGRDRMRKLGKRSCAKSVKSKRLTYNYNKAGCFRGKHGLGLKHSLM